MLISLEPGSFQTLDETLLPSSGQLPIQRHQSAVWSVEPSPAQPSTEILRTGQPPFPAKDPSSPGLGEAQGPEFSRSS